MRRRRLRSAAAGILGVVAIGVTPAAAQQETVGEQVRGRIDAIGDELQETGDFASATAELQVQFDRVIAEADAGNKDLFREAAFALRLAGQLKEVEGVNRLELLAFLRAHEDLAATVAFLVRPEHEKPTDVYGLLDRLRTHRGDGIGPYASLTAAVCVVHDRLLTRKINENTAQAADALSIFDYFAGNERRMLFGVRKVPAELLVYVVDATAGIDELTWALDRYAGDPVVGARFFDIDYDYEHVLDGDPKEVTVAGWNLPNILRYGGVCVDQAYFAVTVGKAIGVPTAYAFGADSTVSHAWVGFLQARGDTAWWNFDVGRYPAYQGVRGNVMDPQTRKRIPDSYVSLLAELAGVDATDRWAAVAYTDAAVRVLERAEQGGGALRGAGETTEEPSTSETALDLIERGLRLSPGYARGWMTVRGLAAEGGMTPQQTKRWADVLHRLCGRRYPDFYLAILRPMITSIDDVRQQNALWNKAFSIFRDRHDLAASVRMSQGRMWREAGQPARAGQCYEDVIFRYANAGPFVLSALNEAEKLLAQAGRDDKVIELYNRAFASIKRPPSIAVPFYRQSNYFRVGARYADRLQQAGHGLQAAAILTRIKAREAG
ncbi:MAG: hypothetical protein ACYTGF_06840 [Planctomycetota bacterium]|jgi:tetratricopeptide (TPR) repeat protein